MQQYNFYKALKCIDAFIEMFKDEIEGYIMKGRCHDHLKEYDIAI